MYTLHINGCNYEAPHDKKLLRFLRDDLHLRRLRNLYGSHRRKKGKGLCS